MILPFMGLGFRSEGLGFGFRGLWVGQTENRVSDVRKTDWVQYPVPFRRSP